MPRPGEVELSRAATEQAVEAVLRNAGLLPDHAVAVRRCLMFAEARGTSSHGLARLRPYVERITAGGINSRPRLTESKRGAVTIVDGDGCMGAVAGLTAVRAATSTAKQHGAGLAGVRNTNHVGALAFYSTELSKAGLVSLVFANADPIMAPPGGREAVVGSNPIAIGVPGDQCESQYPQLDMATTAAAHGKIVELHRQGQSIPPGWALDANGEETTDTAAALSGTLLPAAGAKGFGLAFMIDLLCAGLTGGAAGSDIVPVADRFAETQGACLVVIAVDPSAAAGPASFATANRRLVDAVTGSSPAVHGRPPMVPGQPETERASRNDNTVVVADALHRDFLNLCARWSVDPPPVLASDAT